jgi:hypothetical protein
MVHIISANTEKLHIINVIRFKGYIFLFTIIVAIITFPKFTRCDQGRPYRQEALEIRIPPLRTAYDANVKLTGYLSIMLSKYHNQ